MFFSSNNFNLIPTILKMPDVIIKKDEKIEKENGVKLKHKLCNR